ncbi:MAG TPA: efflux RND transporter periplasmic adaptor subunit [Caulobacteraceae bacterium]|nr:efflux RND transporter periplasmic adaptor subunit [Caulobacteraceae bacterium]
MACYRRVPLAAIGLAWVLCACARPHPPAPPTPEVGVTTLQAQSADIQTELPGRTSAVETADVRPQVSGIILSRAFVEGSQVSRGQLLYQIDPAPYQAAYASAQAQLANAQAVDRTAKLKAQRYDDLVKINAVSRQDADDARATAGQAAANVQQAEAAVQTAKINLNYTKVSAPISGHVGRSTVTPGALVTANQAAALTTIQQMDRVYVDITQSSTQLLALRQAMDSGHTRKGDLAVHLKLEDGSDYPTPGVLQFTDVTVDPATGTVTLRAIMPNPRGVLLPGMYVRAVVTEAVQADAILAPQAAVARDARGLPIAYVVNAQGKAEQRTLKTGPTIGDKWLVTDGLKPGDRLIVEGLQKVRDGVPVRAVPAGSPPAGGPAKG